MTETTPEMVSTTEDNSVMEAKRIQVGKEIQEILEANEMALYPFIDVQSNAHIARVTLVSVPPKEVTEPIVENA